MGSIYAGSSSQGTKSASETAKITPTYLLLVVHNEREPVSNENMLSASATISTPLLQSENKVYHNFKDSLSFTSSRSEEHTSELQSRPHLVCRLLLEKKKKKTENSV